jgi:acetyl esterase/lipase
VSETSTDVTVFTERPVRLEPAPDEALAAARNLNLLVAAAMPMIPPYSTAEGLAQLRTDDVFAQPALTEGAHDRTVPGPAGAIPIRVVEPAGDVRAVRLDLHGGGWCIGSKDGADQRAKEHADATGSVVISVDYRLAPEHPWPAGPDDAEAVTRWVLEHAVEEWSTSKIVLGGGSAGAHLTAVTLVRLRDRLGAEALRPIVAVVLEAGCFDLGPSDGVRAHAEGLVIPLTMIEACLANVLPGRDETDRRSPEISPLFADLHDLPPALFVVGAIDPLLEDSILMSERWAAAGNEAELAVYPESPHAFTALPSPIADAARRRVLDFVLPRL